MQREHTMVYHAAWRARHQIAPEYDRRPMIDVWIVWTGVLTGRLTRRRVWHAVLTHQHTRCPKVDAAARSGLGASWDHCWRDVIGWVRLLLSEGGRPLAAAPHRVRVGIEAAWAYARRAAHEAGRPDLSWYSSWDGTPCRAIVAATGDLVLLVSIGVCVLAITFSPAEEADHAAA